MAAFCRSFLQLVLRTKHRTKEVEGWVQDELHSQLLIPLLTVCLSWQLVSICVNVPAVAETSGRPPIELYIKMSWGKTSINNYFYEEFVLPRVRAGPGRTALVGKYLVLNWVEGFCPKRDGVLVNLWLLISSVEIGRCSSPLLWVISLLGLSLAPRAQH